MSDVDAIEKAIREWPGLIEDEDGAPLPDMWQPPGLMMWVWQLMDERDELVDRLDLAERCLGIVCWEQDLDPNALRRQARADLADIAAMTEAVRMREVKR